MTYVEWLDSVRKEVVDASPQSQFAPSDAAYDSWKSGEAPESYAKAWVVQLSNPATSTPSPVQSIDLRYVKVWPTMVAYQGGAVLAPFAGLAVTDMAKNLAPLYLAGLLSVIAGICALVIALRVLITKPEVDDQVCAWIVVGCNVLGSFVWAGWLFALWSGAALQTLPSSFPAPSSAGSTSPF